MLCMYVILSLSAGLPQHLQAMILKFKKASLLNISTLLIVMPCICMITSFFFFLRNASIILILIFNSTLRNTTESLPMERHVSCSVKVILVLMKKERRNWGQRLFISLCCQKVQISLTSLSCRIDNVPETLPCVDHINSSEKTQI